MKFVINSQVVLSRAARRSSRGTYRLICTIDERAGIRFVFDSVSRFALLHVLADGLNKRGSKCAAFPPIIRRSIYDIVLGTNGSFGGCCCAQASH